MRVAAVGDLHCREDQHGALRPLVNAVNAQADLLLLCGDLTDRGMVEEAHTLAEELSGLRVPCVAVLGNHDFDRGTVKEVSAELTRVGVHLLDGDRYVLDGKLGVAGIKGYAGGYGAATLQAFGEVQTKAFVQELVSESLKLDYALGQLDVPRKLVIMHYSPIIATTQGELLEIRPFLGSSRLAGPIDRYGADAVFHGHCHHGSLEGRTEKGVPVYNVAQPALLRADPGRPFIVLEF